MTITIEEAVEKFGVDVLEHLDREATVPVLSGLQAQGDVLVVPAAMAGIRIPASKPVTKAGFAVVRGESGGNTHTLLPDGDVRFDAVASTGADLRLGVLTVADGAVAYLAHPEHAYSGIAPGTYEVRRQREQRDEIALVAD